MDSASTSISPVPDVSIRSAPPAAVGDISNQALALRFAKTTRIAGETIYGIVDVNLQMLEKDAIETVRIKLRGQALSKITIHHGQSSTTYRQNIPLIREDLLLWSKDPSNNSVDPNSSHLAFHPDGNPSILSLPFSFSLPPDLPPSFHATAASSQSARIQYAIEGVGDRPGLFKFNRRVRSFFVIVPQGTQEMVNLRRKMWKLGMEPTKEIRENNDVRWDGNWGIWKKEKDIRQGIFGGYGKVKFELSIPAINQVPIFVPIPYKLTVTTITKPINASEALQDPYNPESKEALFPCPSASASGISLRVDRNVIVTVKVRHRILKRFIEDDLSHLGGTGRGSQRVPTPTTTGMDRLEIKTASPEFHGEAKNKGCWKREVDFKGTFSLSEMPTFELENIKCYYTLHVKIPFPGIGNDLKEDINIQLASGFLPQPPTFETASWGLNISTNGYPGAATEKGQDLQHKEEIGRLQTTSEDNSEGDDDWMAPPEMDLPPAYFNDNDDKDWDFDEKK